MHCDAVFFNRKGRTGHLFTLYYTYGYDNSYNPIRKMAIEGRATYNCEDQLCAKSFQAKRKHQGTVSKIDPASVTNTINM